jgi:hypothetical protein
MQKYTPIIISNEVTIRFLKKIVLTPSCWLFAFPKQKTYEYGGIQVNGIKISAHRYSYTLFKGEISHGLLVLHSCDNPHCVNPHHLSLGTQKDNMIDCSNKVRHFNQVNRDKIRAERGCKIIDDSGRIYNSIPDFAESNGLKSLGRIRMTLQKGGYKRKYNNARKLIETI